MFFPPHSEINIFVDLKYVMNHPIPIPYAETSLNEPFTMIHCFSISTFYYLITLLLLVSLSPFILIVLIVTIVTM